MSGGSLLESAEVPAACGVYRPGFSSAGRAGYRCTTGECADRDRPRRRSAFRVVGGRAGVRHDHVEPFPDRAVTGAFSAIRSSSGALPPRPFVPTRSTSWPGMRARHASFSGPSQPGRGRSSLRPERIPDRPARRDTWRVPGAPVRSPARTSESRRSTFSPGIGKRWATRQDSFSRKPFRANEWEHATERKLRSGSAKNHASRCYLA